MKNKKGGERLQAKAALLLVLLVFATAPIVTTLATTFIIPAINLASLSKTTTHNIVFGIQPMGDPVDNPVGPGWL